VKAVDAGVGADLKIDRIRGGGLEIHSLAEHREAIEQRFVNERHERSILPS
jgi:hypothetical protein